jgi:hypothetical protein
MPAIMSRALILPLGHRLIVVTVLGCRDLMIHPCMTAKGLQGQYW